MIEEIRFNWHPVGDIKEGVGEDWSFAKVGEPINGRRGTPPVERIEEHPARGEGDKWYYDAVMADGSIERIFNPNRVYYKAK